MKNIEEELEQHIIIALKLTGKDKKIGFVYSSSVDFRNRLEVCIGVSPELCVIIGYRAEDFNYENIKEFRGAVSRYLNSQGIREFKPQFIRV